MANHNNRRNTSHSPSKSNTNSLNANAQAFIPSPISSKSPSNTSSCGESPCFAKSKLETIPESPSIAPLQTHKLSMAPRTATALSTSTPPNTQHPPTPFATPPQSHTQFPFNPLSLPQFYANQMNDTLALIPAMDQNGLLVMIPPSLATPGSLFTPIINVGQPLPATMDHEDNIYQYMDIDTNQHEMDETYQNIDDMKREIQEKYENDTIQSLPKPSNNKYSNTFLLRTGHILHKTDHDDDATDANDDNILQNIPKDLQFLLSTSDDQQQPEGEHLPTGTGTGTPLSLHPLFVSPHAPIADMQSLLFMNNYAAITPQFFPLATTTPLPPPYNPVPPPQTPPKRRKKYGANSYKLPPRFQHSRHLHEAEREREKESQQVLEHKVVYLVEDGNKSNGGFAQYSLSPTSSRQSTPKPRGHNKRYKQSLTGMKFEGRRNKEVHECFKDNPDLFAKGGYQSVMNKITYQIPTHQTNANGAAPAPAPAHEDKSLHKTFSGILNKLTPQKFGHLVNVTVDVMHNGQDLRVIASIFHAVVTREKPLVRLYAEFLIAISRRIPHHKNHNKNNNKKKKAMSLLDLVVNLVWKQVESQYTEHEAFCSERARMEADAYGDSAALKELNQDYNDWLHRLYGNYVLLTELYCRKAVSFSFDRLHAIITQLIAMNAEWTWNIVYVILIFHGVALQKLETKSLEEYLESIDELVGGIHYADRREEGDDDTATAANANANANDKYAHIPLRIKYLLMDVQEHIESKNANTMVLDPKKLNEIHAEFCRENNMTQHQLRKLLSLSNIQSTHAHSHHHSHHVHHPHPHPHPHPHHHHNNNKAHAHGPYLQRRFAPQQNEYPWHTPPRFQRMRQQQRLQNKQKKKENKNRKDAHTHTHTQQPQPQPQPQPHTPPMTVKGPLYLRNAAIPAPPNKCPPPPPGPPGPYGTVSHTQHHTHHPHTTTHHHTPQPQLQPMIKVIANRHHSRKKKKHNAAHNHNGNGNGNGWSTVKRSNNKTKKSANVAVNKKNATVAITNKKHSTITHPTTHKLAVEKQKEKEIEMIAEEEEQEAVVVDEAPHEEAEEGGKKEVTRDAIAAMKPKKVKNKKKKKKKKHKNKKKKQNNNKKKKQKEESGSRVNANDKSLVKAEEIEAEEDDDDDDDDENNKDDYDSDDEIWCETTESYDAEDDVVPAFLFGAENETERIEELETALFCEYIDDDEEDEEEEDACDDAEIIEIINRYLETGSEDEACLYFANGANEERNKDVFIANCIKLYITNGIMDNAKSQYDLQEIERLFVRQMYFNSILHKRNYLHSLILLSGYFESILVATPNALQPLCKICVVLIQNKIVRMTDVANTLYLDANCANAMDILYEMIKHLMHYQMGHTLKFKAFMKEVKQIKFIPSQVIRKISNELNINYY